MLINMNNYQELNSVHSTMLKPKATKTVTNKTTTTTGTKPTATITTKCEWEVVYGKLSYF